MKLLMIPTFHNESILLKHTPVDGNVAHTRRKTRLWDISMTQLDHGGVVTVIHLSPQMSMNVYRAIPNEGQSGKVLLLFLCVNEKNMNKCSILL